MSDLDHMRSALALARRGLGGCWPNPAVGCVIVQGGRVIGRAVTAPGGRPHAEPQALAMAGDAARGATAYVTLEPCSHHGHTSPCADAMIAAGVARVVIATLDPDPRVNGSGAARMQAAGISVDVGLLSAEAQDLCAGFASKVTLGRPLVTLKLATTLDGRIATRTGESQWITQEPARKAAHALRGRNDAVLVGVGTVLADNPELSCRIDGFKPVPTVRVVADSHLRTPLLAKLVSGATAMPTWMLTCAGADPARRQAMQGAGVELIDVGRSELGVDLADALGALAKRGITRLLVEGGASIAAALLRADLVDRLVWFHAPGVIGADGWPAAQAYGVARLGDMKRFVRDSERSLGADVMSEFRRLA